MNRPHAFSTVEEREAYIKANRDRYTPERLLEVTEQLIQAKCQRALMRHYPHLILGG